VALKLAEQLAPSEIPVISREYAQQLEFKGEAQAALDYYMKGMIEDAPEETSEEAEYAHRKKMLHNKAWPEPPSASPLSPLRGMGGSVGVRRALPG
jgi:hypothetical protein